MVLVFVGVAWTVFAGDMAKFDETVALTMKDSESASLWHLAMIGFTIFGNVPAMTCLVILCSAWQWRRGRWRVALAWVVLCGGGAALNQCLKKSFDRSRPPLEWRDPVAQERNESFPSGHSMGSIIALGMLAFTLLLDDRSRRARVAIVAGLAIVALFVGLSRIYLRAHWFSDVVAGFAMGAAWLGLAFGLWKWVSHPVYARAIEDTLAAPVGVMGEGIGDTGQAIESTGVSG